MKSEYEIREKIEKYMDKLDCHLSHSFVIGGDAKTVGWYNGIIDALRWVIDEENI